MYVYGCVWRCFSLWIQPVLIRHTPPFQASFDATPPMAALMKRGDGDTKCDKMLDPEMDSHSHLLFWSIQFGLHVFLSYTHPNDESSKHHQIKSRSSSKCPSSCMRKVSSVSAAICKSVSRRKLPLLMPGAKGAHRNSSSTGISPEMAWLSLYPLVN